MTHRIKVEKRADTIWYLVQQRCCLFFWKTLIETQHITDAKAHFMEFMELDIIGDMRYISSLDIYQPKKRGHIQILGKDERPVPSQQKPPVRE